MADIWFVSDTHFGHANMLKFTLADGSLVRPGFHDVTHMDECLIERWNARVKPQDKVYHLGDVGFDPEGLSKILPRLQGKKRLILGNHDQMDMGFYRKHFQKILAWRQFVDGDAAMICSHFPLHPASFLQRYAGRCINVHGHVHARSLKEMQYVNVSVEVTNYAPVNYDTLITKARRIAA